MTKNICLSGMTNRFNFCHPFGVFVFSAYPFYNHFTPSGLGDKS